MPLKTLLIKLNIINVKSKTNLSPELLSTLSNLNKFEKGLRQNAWDRRKIMLL